MSLTIFAGQISYRYIKFTQNIIFLCKISLQNYYADCFIFSHIANLSLHDAPDLSYNQHWLTQTRLCNPCAVNYDYIVRFESMAEDGNHLLKFLQRNDPEEERVFFKLSSASTNDHKITNTFKEISNSTIDQLRKLYSDDFNIVGYAPNVPDA